VKVKGFLVVAEPFDLLDLGLFPFVLFLWGDWPQFSSPLFHFRVVSFHFVVQFFFFHTYRIARDAQKARDFFAISESIFVDILSNGRLKKRL
jgi:hypothetical protein